jgi:hypothetical protein
MWKVTAASQNRWWSVGPQKQLPRRLTVIHHRAEVNEGWRLCSPGVQRLRGPPNRSRGEPTKTIAHARAARRRTVRCLAQGCYHLWRQSLAVKTFEELRLWNDRIFVDVPQHPSSAVLAMWQSKPASDADFSGGTRHAGISRIAPPTVRSTGAPLCCPFIDQVPLTRFLGACSRCAMTRAEFTPRRFNRLHRWRAAAVETGHRG